MFLLIEKEISVYFSHVSGTSYAIFPKFLFQFQFFIVP